MEKNNHRKHRGIIAVFGPEGAGKRTILSCIDSNIPKTIDPYGSKPQDYHLTNSKYLELEKFIFRNYSELSQIKRDYSIYFGLLVFSLRHVMEFKRPDAFQQYYHFLEFLQKFTWLNVSQYLIAITHLDLVSNGDMSWLHQEIDKLEDNLERAFSIAIEQSILLSLNSNGTFQNLFGEKDNGVINKNDQALLPALDSLVSINDKRWSSKTWFLGRLEKEKVENNYIWKTVHKTRGEILKNNKIIVHQKQIDGSIDYQNHFIPSSLIDEAACNEVTGSNINKMILVPYDSTARTATTMDVHVLLRSGISPSDLKDKNRSFFFLFFGPQVTEGDIDRCTPSRRLVQNPSSDIDYFLTESDNYSIHHHLGQEANLRIHCRYANIVVDSWENDPDSGSVLIFDDRGDDNIKLIAIGKIKSFPDSLIKDTIEKLMLYDKYRAQDNSDSRLLSYRFHNVYHTLKNFAANRPQVFTSKFINQRKKVVDEEYDLILEETILIENKIRNGELPRQLGNLFPHLVQLSKKLSEQYDQIYSYVRENKPHDMLKKLLLSMKNEHTKNVEVIRKYTVFPIWSCISEVQRGLGNDIKTKVKIHNLIPKDLAYYPENPTVLDYLFEAIWILIDNSRTHIVNKGDIQIDIFIDPPNLLNPNCVRVQYQDNGIFTNKVCNLIEKGEGALRLLMREFSFKDDEVRLSAGSEIGMATSFVIDIPVWTQKTKRPELILKDLLEIFNAIDYDMLEKGEPFQNYLKQFEKILLSSHTKASGKALHKLVNEAANFSAAYRQVCLNIADRAKTINLLNKGSDLNHIIDMTHNLQFYPVNQMISVFISNIQTADKNTAKNIKVINNTKILHRIRSYKNYNSICHALINMLIVKASEISVEIKYLKDKYVDNILLTFHIPKKSNIKQSVLPLITRLHHLGAGTKKKRKLQIFLPVNKIESEREPK